VKVNPIAAALAAAGLLVAGELPAQTAPMTRAEQALQEYDAALELEPDLENGRQVFRKCAVCHTPEGWGTDNGRYPQIAGQLASVIIKQLADIRAGNRDVPTMSPFTGRSGVGGPQDIADVAAYIANLPMTPSNGQGNGRDLQWGERLYKENCVDCHGENGEGDAEDHIPALYGQHYRYLVRQFEWIRMGKRRNADKEMVEQIRNFTPFDVHAVMDYVSRLRPPADKLAERGWTNPDFPHFARRPGHLR
jgi:cytochrome c553